MNQIVEELRENAVSAILVGIIALVTIVIFTGGVDLLKEGVKSFMSTL